MVHSARKLLSVCLVLAVIIPAQAQSSPMSKQAAAVMQKASQLSPHAPISVIRVNADEEFGKFLSSDATSFTFYDVDQKTNVTLKYLEVKKIKNGFGGYNTAVHRHVDRRKSLIVAAVVVAGLALLIGAAAGAR